MPAFVPGLVLAGAYYDEVVRPLIGDVPHAAARLGWGSDVLGFDTDRSTDHGWGPRLQVFVAAEHVAALRADITAGLPLEFRGWPTSFGWDNVAGRHWVEVGTLHDWLHDHLGFDPRPAPATEVWLSTPQQLLLGVTRGAVFHDPLGELAALRAALAWYPDDVWRYLLTCQWQRIAQVEPFVGRAAQVGDDLGSRLLASQLARDAMRLAFLIEREYAPYTKWFGSAFARLNAATEITAHLHDATTATGIKTREAALMAVLEALARRCNALGLAPAVDPSSRWFHGRPFRVLAAERFVTACRDTIVDPRIRALPLVGAVDQFADSTDVLSNPALVARLRALYDAE
jgi:hypothetical protein